jgi:hypothetical protein
MSFQRVTQILVFALVFWVIGNSACTRITSTELGAGLIPGVDGVNTLDTTLDVITDNFIDPDTARIYKTDNHVLGAITNDPLFGRTEARMLFQLMPEFYPFFISGPKDSLVADSAVLILSYRGFYGDSTQPLRVSVDELSTATPMNNFFNYATDYPQLYNFNTVGSLGNTHTVDIRRLGDSVNNRYEKARNQIRIPLNTSLANRLLKQYDSTNAYRNDTAFKTFFGGLALRVSNATPANALLYINLIDTNSKLALYYNTRQPGATIRDTNVAYFRFNIVSSGDANFVTRNRAGAEVANRLNNNRADSLAYVQAVPGTYVRIRIPHLSRLSNRIIHRAELITEQVPDDANLTTFDRYMPPPRLLLLSIYDSVNKRKINIPNAYSIGLNGPNTPEFGGFLVTKTVPGYDRLASYNFNLTRYVQGIVTRKDSSHVLRLTAPSNDSIHYTPAYPNNVISQTYALTTAFGNDVAAGRVRLGGGGHSRFRMRLRIVYSRLQ